MKDLERLERLTLAYDDAQLKWWRALSSAVERHSVVDVGGYTGMSLTEIDRELGRYARERERLERFRERLARHRQQAGVS